MRVVDFEMTPEMEGKAKLWMAQFAHYDHYIEPSMAVKIAAWWEDGESSLLLEGEAGGGKTRVAEIIPLIVGASFYQLQCFKSIGPKEALYSWDETLQKYAVEIALEKGEWPSEINSIVYDNEKTMRKGAYVQALEDGAKHVIFLLDEVDKLPKDDQAESMFLQVLGSHKITVPENRSEVKRRVGLIPVRSILTSNLGKSGWIDTLSKRESLSYPLLRRCHYIHVPLPSPASQYFILRQAAPGLPPPLALECVQFLLRLRERVKLDKPISIFESKAWVKALQTFKVTALSVSVIKTTISTIAKIPVDGERIVELSDSILTFNERHRNAFIKELQKDPIFEQVKAERANLSLVA